MLHIIRRDPFHQMMHMRNAMDHLFDNPFNGEGSDIARPWAGELALDVVENDEDFVVKASIPGIDPDDLEITFSENTLTVKGEVKSEQEKEDARYHMRERRYGSFCRSITMPTSVNANKIEANYTAGVLNLRLPKSEEAKPKRIAIKTTAPQMIEGKVRDIKNKN